jgi:hypothetical protein
MIRLVAHLNDTVTLIRQIGGDRTYDSHNSK